MSNHFPLFVKAFGLIVWLVCIESFARGEPFVPGFDRFYAGGKTADDDGGRLLLTELSCTACHEASKGLSPKGGPQLVGSGKRLQPDWIVRFLASPTDTKPGTTMPHVMQTVPESERTATIEALAAFLTSSPDVEPKITASGSNPVAHEFWLKGDAVQGRTRYHQVGCVACHAVDEAFQPAKSSQSDLERKIASLGLDPDELEEMGLSLPKSVRPVPMSNIARKYSLRSLSMFLIAPHLVRPNDRMPSLKLQPHEAADIAAYLCSSETHSKPTNDRSNKPVEEIQVNSLDETLVERGRIAFERLACANCHAMPGLQPRPAKPLDALNFSEDARGCLANNIAGPQFELSPVQVTALKRAMLAGRNNQDRRAETADDDTTLTMLQLNCYACHERQGRGGVGPQQWAYFDNRQQVDIGDEGRMPPPLDFAGKKFQPGRLQAILEGKGDVRPHFLARMPVFAEHAKKLSASIVEADRKIGWPNTPDVPTELKPNVEAGRALLDSGCVQCHAFRGESLPGTIGIDLAEIGTRVNRDWFQAFLLNPASLKKNTRMPTFFPDGKSSIPHILQGDVPMQIEALWGYLNAKDQAYPDKLEQSRSQSFELIPTDKPVLLRTFMEPKSAGNHAIAVGFPGKVHFAFDARAGRLAEIWRGKFMNAQGTWFDRFAPTALPLGDERILFPRHGYVVVEEDGGRQVISDTAVTFGGYRLDAKGVPTFHYSVGSLEVHDRIEADSARGLKRILSFNDMTPNVKSSLPGSLPTNGGKAERVLGNGNAQSDFKSTHASEQLWLVLTDNATAVKADHVYETQTKLRLGLTQRAKCRWIPNGEASSLLLAVPDEKTSIEVSYRW